ncbi:MAG TPA: cysteine dioxygenase family protein, partial [Vicinamibacterales bacterium]
GLSDLITRLDRSVEAGAAPAVTAAVKADLEHVLGGRTLALPASFVKPRQEAYARRLLHRDPKGRYTAIVMTWGPGQGTAVHDHGGLWCVEGVVDGEIAVTQYLVQPDPDGYYRVTPIGSLLAGTGSAGCLIPPTDHHVLANARPTRASVTLHIYGGDLDDCKVFLPSTPDGRYAESTRMLSYNE